MRLWENRDSRMLLVVLIGTVEGNFVNFYSNHKCICTL